MLRYTSSIRYLYTHTHNSYLYVYMYSRPQTSGTNSYEITNQSTNHAALVPVVLSPMTPMPVRRPGQSELWGGAEGGAESGAIYTYESTNQASLVPVNTPLAPVN